MLKLVQLMKKYQKIYEARKLRELAGLAHERELYQGFLVEEEELEGEGLGTSSLVEAS